jgi:lactoylglutathione lyase
MRKIACLIVTLAALTIHPQAQAPKKRAVLNHIALYVLDLKTSTHFYQNIIGLDTIPEPFHDGRHTWFSIGAQGHLHVISGAKGKTNHEKNAHLCFSVPSVQEFTAVLKKNNIVFENWAGEKNTITNRVDGVKQIYFTDPDGYWIEINDDKY